MVVVVVVVVAVVGTMSRIQHATLSLRPARFAIISASIPFTLSAPSRRLKRSCSSGDSLDTYLNEYIQFSVKASDLSVKIRLISVHISLH